MLHRSLCFRTVGLGLCLAGVAMCAFAQTVRVDITADHVANTFVPTQALGAGIDRIPTVATDKLFTDRVMQPTLEAGWQTVTYRQNTELHIEAWHWNPEGQWSDPGGKGYFTGSATPGESIRHSFGYFLPHRGSTRNDGAEGDGYSRITDGDSRTYWKSNPYLTKTFTGEDDGRYPQWVVVDLANPLPVNALRIAWGEPYARKYLVQYWTGEDPIKQPVKGAWVAFPGGMITNGAGGMATLQLTQAPIPVRYLRLWMTESSNTCDDHGSSDRRNCVGYAVREIYVGTATEGRFYDLVRHTSDPDQTTTYASSVDPWHTPADINDKHDQVGFDLFYTSGYTRGLPAMVPVAMLYGTPEDSANQIAYLKARGYPISYIEMGEEPDGQYMLPEDYGALYLQWATALHKVDPSLKLGGPVFEGVNEDILVWPDAQGRTSWLGRFIDYLKTHQRMADLNFVSFEHYPYEPCKVQWSSLYDEPALISHIVDVWRADGVPENMPLFVTELNIAWNTGESFVDTFGALWLGDYVGAFLTAGGDGLYYFHYLPLGLYHGCGSSQGTFGMFTMDKYYQVEQKTSQFFASQLINLEWVQPGDGQHRVFPAASDITDPAGHVLVTAYAVQRPDGQWALMLINKDQENAHAVKLTFHDDKEKSHSFFSGPVQTISFGSEQYQWHGAMSGGFADPDGPAVKANLVGGADTVYTLPKASMTVVRGKLGSGKK
ncbi:MAG: discoidin domain-containing protein [Acidobacteria bacterium]|nr:discoidin domain-containing protein [Acidobacteriota bacterium]